MSTAALANPAEAPEEQWPKEHYLNAKSGVWSWMTTTDHKRIGVMFFFGTATALIVGGIYALLLRIELLTPGHTIVDANTYNRFFTMHGIVMVWLFMIPSIPTVFGNFLLPIMIGARDVAFPRLNLASFYIYLIGAAFTIWALVDGGVGAGVNGGSRGSAGLGPVPNNPLPDTSISSCASRYVRGTLVSSPP